VFRTITTLASLLAASALVGAPADTPPAPIVWAKGLDAALASASTEYRPVIVLFSMPSCGWCKKLKDEMLPAPEVAALLAHFVRVEIDITTAPERAAQFGIRAVPAIRILSADGTVRDGHNGAIGIPALQKLLGGALNEKFLKAQPGAASDLLKLLESGEIKLSQWPKILSALGDPNTIETLRPKALSLRPFPRLALVRMLQSPQLSVRLGALDLLEERAGETFGFDPWGDVLSDAGNAAALERWRTWSETGRTDPESLHQALSPEEISELLPELLSDNPATSATAFRRLVHAGDSAVSDLGHLILLRTDLPPATLRQLKADQYALAIGGDLSAERRKLGRALLFGTVDSRARAINALPGIAGANAAAILLELLEDPDPLLRESAVDALIKTGRRNVAPPLAAHLAVESDRNVAYTILRGLGKLRSKRGLAALSEHISNNDEDIAIVAIEGVKRLGIPTDQAKKNIIAALDDDRWRVKIAAISAAEKLRIKDATKPIENLLATEDVFVQQQAIAALAALGDRKAFAKMETLFSQPGSPKVAIIKAYASRDMPLPDTFINLLADEEPDILFAAIDALAGTLKSNPSALDHFLHSDNIDLAVSAVRTVASRGMKSMNGKRQILKVLSEGSPTLKKAAIGAISMSRNEFAGTNAKTGAALAALKTKGHANLALAESAVLAFIKEYDRAEKSVTTTRSERAAILDGLASAIRDLTGDDDPLIRFQAASFLAEMGLPGGLKIAAAELGDRTESERDNLASTLRYSTEPGTIELIATLLRDPSAKVRLSATHSGLHNENRKAAERVLTELLTPGTKLTPSQVWDNGLDSLSEKDGTLTTPMREQAKQILREGAPTGLVSLAIFMLQESMSTSQQALVEPYLRSDNAIHRRAAFRAFAKSSPTRFLEMIHHAAADPSPLVRAVISNAFSRTTNVWLYHFDSKHTITSYDYFSNYSSSGRSKPKLAAPAREVLLKLTTAADPKLRLDTFFALMSNGELIDVDSMLATVNSFPDRGAVEKRILSYIQDNHASLDKKHYQKFSEFLSATDPDNRRMAAALKHFGSAGAEGSVRLSLLDAPPTPDSALAATATAEEKNPTATDDAPIAPPERLKVIYFFKPGCDICVKVQDHIRNLRQEFPTMDLVRHDSEKQATKEYLEALCEREKVPPELRLAPIVFTGAGYASKNETTYPGLLQLFAKTMAEPERAGWDIVKAEQIAAAAENIKTRFDTFGMIVVAGAGLLDGINPCAFATIIFFLSYLQIARRNTKQILQVGFSFISAVFLTYFVIGMGLIKVVAKIHEFAWAGQILNWVFAAIAFVIMIYCIRDGILCLKGRLAETSLQLPAFLKKRIHSTIRSGARHRRFVIAAFVVGVVISVLELACTGQVYLPTIGYMIGRGESVAYWYLLLYNIAFVVPLIVIFALALTGMKSDALIRFQKNHTAAVKFATAGIFLVLGVFLVLHTLAA